MNVQDSDQLEPSTNNSKLRNIEGATIKHTQRFILTRWKNLQEVRHHASGWLLLLLGLSVAVIWQGSQTNSLYTQPVAAENATYTEGVYGAVDNINPIFAATQAERAASKLIFDSLLTYDDKGDLVGSLAKDWTAGTDAKSYTVNLRPNARWHDGAPITSKDVVFTFELIKDASTKSPLYSSWRNISVAAVGERSIRFTLPTAHSPFPNALTVGILPEHILGKIKHSELRNTTYNRKPTVGSGAFIFQDIRAVDGKQEHFLIRLAANSDYYLGKPKLDRFHLHAYANRDLLLDGFNAQEVSAASDLSTDHLKVLAGKKDIVRSESPLDNAVYAFLKTSSPILGDGRVRRALELATDKQKIIQRLDNRFQAVSGPLLQGQLGYNPVLKEADLNMEQAAQLLDVAGWKLQSNGKRIKDGQELRLQLVTISSGDYPVVAQEITSQWVKLGVSFDSQLVKADDIQQNILVPRAYDVLIYDIALGADPDIYAYWHSSQVNERGFNLSDYKSAKADDALDSARAQLNEALRIAKYQAFAQQWLADVPAIGLYRPSLSYVQTKNVTSFQPRILVDQSSRYFDARFWSSSKQNMRVSR